jgi:hypothetical protein
MHRELVTGIDAASPPNTICVKTNLISLGCIDPFEANLRRADGQTCRLGSTGGESPLPNLTTPPNEKGRTFQRGPFFDARD